MRLNGRPRCAAPLAALGLLYIAGAMAGPADAQVQTYIPSWSAQLFARGCVRLAASPGERPYHLRSELHFKPIDSAKQGVIWGDGSSRATNPTLVLYDSGLCVVIVPSGDTDHLAPSVVEELRRMDVVLEQIDEQRLSDEAVRRTYHALIYNVPFEVQVLTTPSGPGFQAMLSIDQRREARRP